MSLSRKQIVTDVRPVSQRAKVSCSVLGYIWVSEKENVKVIELKVINLTVIHVRKLINNSHIKTIKYTSFFFLGAIAV